MLGGVEVLQSNRPTLRFGDRSVEVGVWQVELSDRGYHLGRADKDFGRLTRAATLAFQADNDLPSDGVVDADDWLQMAKATPRPERFVTQEEIDRESGTAQDAQMTARVGDLVGLGGVAGIATQAKQAGEAAQAASGVMGQVSAMVTEHWPALLLCGLCVTAWFALRALGYSTRRRRLLDARENRSLAR